MAEEVPPGIGPTTGLGEDPIGVLVCLGAGQVGADFAAEFGSRFEAVIEADTVDECFTQLFPQFAGRMAREFYVIVGAGSESLISAGNNLASQGASVVGLADNGVFDASLWLVRADVHATEIARFWSIYRDEPSPLQEEAQVDVVDPPVPELEDSGSPTDQPSPPPATESVTDSATESATETTAGPSDSQIGEPEDSGASEAAEMPVAANQDNPKGDSAEKREPEDASPSRPRQVRRTKLTKRSKTAKRPTPPKSDEVETSVPPATDLQDQLPVEEDPPAIDQLPVEEDPPAPPVFEMEEEGGATTPNISNPQPLTVGPSLFQTRPRKASAGTQRGKMIVVAGPKGGIGKTTFSIFIAETLGRCLEKEGRKVCYLDANVGQADGGAYLEKYVPKVGLRTIVSLAKNPDLPSIGLVTTKMEGLHFDGLFGPRSNTDVATGLITPNIYALAADKLLNEYDYVVVDTQVAEFGNNMFSFFLLPHMDHLICLVPPIPQAVDRTELWLQSISDPAYTHNSSVPAEKISVLMNGFDSGSEYTSVDAGKVLSNWDIVGEIPQVPALSKATLRRDLLSALPAVAESLEAALAEITDEQGLRGKQTTNKNGGKSPTSRHGKRRSLLRRS
jgi:cellulose biosynthesis protein BcsQ